MFRFRTLLVTGALLVPTSPALAVPPPALAPATLPAPGPVAVPKEARAVDTSDPDRWVGDGTLELVLEALARGLKERGQLDLSICSGRS